MPKYTNAADTASTKGIREELSDVIGMVKQDEQPMLYMMKNEKTGNPIYTTQVQPISKGTPTPLPEGFVFEPQASVTTQVLMNATTILSANAVVARNVIKADTAGRKNDLAYQIEIKRDDLMNQIETLWCDKQQMTAGTTRVSKGLVGIFDANPASSRATGSNGPAAGAYDSTTAVTDVAAGSRRAFTEDLLLDTLQALKTAGAKPTHVMGGPTQVRKMAAFPGRSANQVIIKDGTVSRGTRVYDSEFGLLDVEMNFNMRATDVFVLTKGTFRKRVIDWFTVRNPPVAFDGEAREIVVDAGPEVLVPQANAVIRDLSL